MRLTSLLLIKRGWLRFPHQSPESFKLIRFGKLKWRDYTPKEIDPPYWYKWTTESPYHPSEQQKILGGESIHWYLQNYKKLQVVEPDKWLYKVGDRVEILKGKDKGKKGDIIQDAGSKWVKVECDETLFLFCSKVVPEGNLIIVGGMNRKRTMQEDELKQVEQPLTHDEISLLDPKSEKATTATFKVDDEGNRVRVSDESGHVIPWPKEILADGTPKEEYIFGDKDTSYYEACTRTYKPTLLGWEEELDKIYGVNDPPRRMTFWY